ncbi:MAG: DUF4369 domain-containing protein, partial [Candidatus Marinimicrobia bacterium]|nr:DUF4369 domain-containing protein [Candidatus Neomarinimicrobiota bacterium]
MLFKSNIFLLALFLLSCSDNQGQGYTIQGKINGITHGTAVLSKLDMDTNQKVNVDSSEIIHGQFSFSGKV